MSSYQPQVQKTQKYEDSQGSHIVHEGKLVLLETDEQIKQYDFCSHLNNGYSIISTVNHQSFAQLHGYKKAKPIIISEAEEIEEGDWYLYNRAHDSKNPNWVLRQCKTLDHIEGSETQYDGSHKIWCSKVLALPQHFSDKHLQAIVDEKMKDGDEVLVNCCVSRNKGGKVDHYYIMLDQQNHIELLPSKDTLENLDSDLVSKKERGYECVCGGTPNSTHITETYLIWKCSDCGRETTVEIMEHPSWVERKESNIISSSKDGMEGTYIVERSNGEKEEFDMKEVHNHQFSSKKLKNMSRTELMIHLYTVSKILEKEGHE